MFVRKGFVTNSSSTAFIAWGYIVENIPEELPPVPDEVAVIVITEQYGYIYAVQSRKQNDFEGETDPYYFSDQKLCLDGMEEWDRKIRAFYRKIFPYSKKETPYWFFAHYGTSCELKAINVKQ